MRRTKKFSWERFIYDCNDFIAIDKTQYPTYEAVRQLILDEILPGIDGGIYELRIGWCKWMLQNVETEDGWKKLGGYVVEICDVRPGRRLWFPVWILELEE